jgi:ribosomal protein S18 acetylase RimI-like enzyme
MTAVRIRRAMPADAASLSLVAGETFPLACPPGLAQASIQAFVDKNFSIAACERYLSTPNYRVWLAHDAIGVEVLGYLIAIHTDPDDPLVGEAIRHRPTVELSKIYVRAAHHGQGVADLLMASAVKDATESGARSLWLGVNKLNHRAYRFYDKHGFRVVGERAFQVGEEWESDWVRELVL